MSQVILFILIRLTSTITIFLVNRNFCWCCTILFASNYTVRHSTRFVLQPPPVPSINTVNGVGCRNSSSSSCFHPQMRGPSITICLPPVHPLELGSSFPACTSYHSCKEWEKRNFGKSRLDYVYSWTGTKSSENASRAFIHLQAQFTPTAKDDFWTHL